MKDHEINTSEFNFIKCNNDDVVGIAAFCFMIVYSVWKKKNKKNVIRFFLNTKISILICGGLTIFFRGV